MLNIINVLLATTVSPPQAVPDSGMTVALVTGSVITLGLFARFVRRRRK